MFFIFAVTEGCHPRERDKRIKNIKKKLKNTNLFPWPKESLVI